MPLNLGDINFGLGADTRGLRAAVAQVRRFGAEVERAASMTGEGARRTEAAYRRQEAAITRALQQTVNFNQQVRQAGLSLSRQRTLVRASNKAVRDFANEMTRGERSALGFQRAQEKFSASTNKVARDLRRVKAEARGTTEGIRGLGVSIKDATSGAILALGPLSGFGARIAALGSITARTSGIIAAAIGGMAALSVGFSTATTSAVAAERQFETISAQMESVTGSAAAATAQLDEIRGLADDTGTSFTDLAGSFARLSTAAAGTGLEGEAVSQILEDLTFAAAKFRLPAQQVVGVLRAIEQIMSKGTVQAEELRGQLGDRLTGAFNIAARAMGVTTVRLNEMLKQGQVLAEDFLPQFAAEVRRAFGAETLDRVDTFEATIGRLRNAMFEAALAFDRVFGVSSIVKGALEALTVTFTVLANNMDVVQNASIALAAGLIGLAAPEILKGLGFLVTQVDRLGKALLALSAANVVGGLTSVLTIITRLVNVIKGLSLAALFTGIPGIVLRVGAAVGAAVGAFALLQDNNDKLISSQKQLTDSVEEFIAAQKQADDTRLSRVQERIDDVRKGIADSVGQANILIERLKEIEVPSPADVIGMEGTPFEGATASGSEEADRVRRITAALAQLEAQRKVLGNQLRQLLQLEGELAKIERERAEAAAKAREKTIASIDQSIDRMFQEAAAIREGGAAVKVLKERFEDLDTVQEVIKDLAKEGITFETDADIFVERINRVRQALSELRAAGRDMAIEGARESIRELEALTMATLDGEGAIDRLKQSMEDTQAIEKFRQQMHEQTGSLLLAKALAEDYARALNLLREAQRQAATEGAQVIIQSLEAESQAIMAGTEAHEAFQATVERSEFLDEWRAKLDKAGVATEKLEAILGDLADAFDDVRRATRAVAIQNAIAQITSETLRLKAESTALQRSISADNKEIFESYKDITDVTEALTSARQDLIDQGVPVGERVVLLQGLRAELEKNVALQKAFNDAFSGEGGGGETQDPAGKLAEVRREIQLINGEMEALRQGPAFADLFREQRDIAEEVHDTADALREEGVSADAAAAAANRLGEALSDLAELERTIAQQEVLGDVRREIERLATIAKTIEFGDTRLVEDLEQLFGRQDQIRQFRDTLEQIIPNQELVNKLTAEYGHLLERLDLLEPVLQRQLQAWEAVRNGFESGLEAIGQFFNNLILDQELNFQSLVDAGRRVVSELINEFFRLAVIKPLMDSIFNPTLSGGGGGGGGGFLGSVFSSLLGGAFTGAGGIGTSVGAGGSLFSNSGSFFAGGAGRVPIGFARGGVLDGPTLFSTGSGGGQLAIGGEAGEEGLLPLTRTSSGDLGVKAEGTGMTQIINIQTQDADSFFRARSQVAAAALKFAQAGRRNV